MADRPPRSVRARISISSIVDVSASSPEKLQDLDEDLDSRVLAGRARAFVLGSVYRWA